MSELLAVYGFVTSLARGCPSLSPRFKVVPGRPLLGIIALSIDAQKYSLFAGMLDLAAGASVGFGCLASGLTSARQQCG